MLRNKMFMDWRERKQNGSLQGKKNVYFETYPQGRKGFYLAEVRSEKVVALNVIISNVQHKT